MANRCNQVMYDFTKILFRKMEAARLVVFVRHVFLSFRKGKNAFKTDLLRQIADEMRRFQAENIQTLGGQNPS